MDDLLIRGGHVLSAHDLSDGGLLVAAAEMVLRLANNIHAPYYALTIVGPAAMAIDIWRNSKKQPMIKTAATV